MQKLRSRKWQELMKLWQMATVMRPIVTLFDPLRALLTTAWEAVPGSFICRTQQRSASFGRERILQASKKAAHHPVLEWVDKPMVTPS